MRILKKFGSIGVFFVMCVMVFGFSHHIVFAEPTTEKECKASLDIDGAPGFCNPKSKGCGAGVVYGSCEKERADGTVGEERVCCLMDKPEGNPTSPSDCTSKGGTCENGSQCQNSTHVIDGNCGRNASGITQICCRPKTDSSPSSSTTASLDYTPLENLPGFENQGGDFGLYFKSLYLLALWIVGISALFMLVVGGFLYLSSAGNTATLGFAKKTIYAALIGLVIALISWLLLDTINSDLTNLKLSGLSGIGGSSSGGAPTTPPVEGSAGKVLEEAYKMVTLSQQGKCEYSQQTPRNGCDQSKSYPHTDCSDFTVSAYKGAGCSSPPDGTANMVGVAEEIGDKGSLKAGDAIVYNHGASGGHVVICENNGCSTYTAAASTKSDLVRGRDSGHMFKESGLKVIRVSKYCKDS